MRAVAQVYNPSMQEAEAGGLPGQPGLHVETLSVNKDPPRTELTRNSTDARPEGSNRASPSV